MNTLAIIYPLSGFLMVAIPIGLAIIIKRAWFVDWKIWWIGGGTFLLSQILHIPFNLGVGVILNRSDMIYWSSVAKSIFNSVFLGLSAGIFEEGARFVVLKLWAKPIRSWKKGIFFGIGHGGMESIVIGSLVIFNFIQLLILSQANSDELIQLVGSERIFLLQSQLSSAWSAPWYLGLLGVLERIFTIPVHVFLAILVLQSVIRNQVRWLVIAVLFHAAIDGLVVFLNPYVNVFVIEGIIGGVALICLILTRVLRQPEPLIQPIHHIVHIQPFHSKPVNESDEKLDDSRYLE